MRSPRTVIATLVATLIATLGLVPCALPAHADEAPQPLSARAWVNLRVVGRFDAYAEVCTKHMDGAGGAWERALAGIRETVEYITTEQLSTTRYAALDKTTLPAATAAERLRSADRARAALESRLESQDPFNNCPRFLRNAQGFGDDDLRPIVKEALAGYQAMLAAAGGVTAPSAPRSRPAPRHSPRADRVPPR